MCAKILGRHRRVDALDVRCGRECLDLADRPAPHRDRGAEVGEDLDDPAPGHELRQVEPVRADVADRAELAATLGLEPPVPVLGRREPVLEVAAVHRPDLSQLARVHALAGLLHERVEAHVEVRAVHESAPLGQLDELRGLRRRHRQWLLADDVLARLERLLHLRMVEVVGRRQMDDVDLVVGENRVVALVGASKPFGRGALGRGACDARHLDPDAPQRVDVDGSDEPRADDRGPEWGGSGRGAGHGCVRYSDGARREP